MCDYAFIRGVITLALLGVVLMEIIAIRWMSRRGD